jgi:DNA-directed RNA polymerase subunit RPC12/RpoP
MKCSICGKEIETTFLGKIKGNYRKKGGKLYAVCNECIKKRL